MADTYTSAGVAWANFVTTAYDRAFYYALRDEPQWRAVVDTKPSRQAMPGNVVTMSKLVDMALATTPLTETVDVTAPGQTAPVRVPITLNEYGNADVHTEALRQLAFVEVDPAIAELLARNMADSLDAVIRVLADASNYVLYRNAGAFVASSAGPITGDQNAVVSTDIMTGKTCAAATALLRRRKVNGRGGPNPVEPLIQDGGTISRPSRMPGIGGRYVALAHPDVLFDIMTEAPSNAAWLLPHAYVDPAELYAGEVGTYQGARYVETTRVTNAVNAGPAVNVYQTYYVGQGAIAEAVGGMGMGEPHVVIGPQVDKLRRFYPIGWKSLLGWSIFRQEAIQQVRTTSTLQGL